MRLTKNTCTVNIKEFSTGLFSMVLYQGLYLEGQYYGKHRVSSSNRVKVGFWDDDQHKEGKELIDGDFGRGEELAGYFGCGDEEVVYWISGNHSWLWGACVLYCLPV